jgi:hypothetical protein
VGLYRCRDNGRCDCEPTHFRAFKTSSELKDIADTKAAAARKKAETAAFNIKNQDPGKPAESVDGVSGLKEKQPRPRKAGSEEPSVEQGDFVRLIFLKERCHKIQVA